MRQNNFSLWSVLWTVLIGQEISVRNPRNPTSEKNVKNRITVAVVSRNRPLLLTRLLDSFVRMNTILEQTEIRFVVVENNAEKSLEYEDAIRRFKKRLEDAGLEHKVSHELETRIGIPYARNKALRMAMSSQSDFLAFTDEDDQVPENWLLSFSSVYRTSDADLICGLIEYVLWEHEVNELTRFQRFWGRAVVSNRLKHQMRREKRDKVRESTGNLFINLAFVERHGIQFDETIGFCMGEDTQFVTDCKSAGAKTAFAADATVKEALTRDRISIPHVFHRARACAVVASRIRGKSKLRNIGSIAGHLLMCAPHIILAIFQSSSLVWICEKFGNIAGCAQHILGIREIEIYRKTTGH